MNKKPLAIVFLILLAFTSALVFLSIPTGFYAVFSGRLSSFTAPFQTYFWIGAAVFPGIAVNAGIVFALVMAIYIALLVFGISQKVRPWKAAAGSIRGGFDSLLSSPFFVMMIAIGFLTLTLSLIDLINPWYVVPVGTIAGNPLDTFVGIAYAPIVEEIGFRVLLIGVVALLLSNIGRGRKTWKSAIGVLWRPSRATEGVSGRRKTSLIVWVVVVASALIYGGVHGSPFSFDSGAILGAIFGGLVLGYLYVKYGLHVAIITHWGVAFVAASFAFFGQAAYNTPWNSANAGYIIGYLADYDLLFLFGVACVLLVVYLGVRKIANMVR